MAEPLTVSDAARRCGVTRRTRQRAILAGRLVLTPDHRLMLDALRQVGYVPMTTTQRQPHGTTQRLSQSLAPVVERLNQEIPQSLLRGYLVKGRA
jgi:hypothetical protein